MIEVRNLSKSYGERAAIRGITFEVARGEILGFLGPNGAGKTTTMKILTCFMPATSGVARVAGFDVFEAPLEVKRRVGYLPETPPVYREMVVQEYLDFKASLHDLRGPQKTAAVNTALEKCGLGHVRHRLIGNLSKGYRQRVGLAQAIVHNPLVLVLDEPTVGLDPKQIIEIRELIKSFSGDHTVILSTHILPEVQATCSRVLIINEGKIAATERIDALSAQVGKTQRISLIASGGSADVAKVLRSVPGVLGVHEVGRVDGAIRMEVSAQPDTDVRGEIASAVVQGGFGLLELRRETLSLEEVFLKLTTTENTSPREVSV